MGNIKIIGIADKMKSVRLAQIFSSELGGKPDAEWYSVEDLQALCGQKRCTKMAVLNLSVLPIQSSNRRMRQNFGNRSHSTGKSKNATTLLTSPSIKSPGEEASAAGRLA